jgi:hypothetical protein
MVSSAVLFIGARHCQIRTGHTSGDNDANPTQGESFFFLTRVRARRRLIGGRLWPKALCFSAFPAVPARPARAAAPFFANDFFAAY